MYQEIASYDPKNSIKPAKDHNNVCYILSLVLQILIILDNKDKKVYLVDDIKCFTKI